MPPTIIRCEKNRDHPYVMIDKRVAEDLALSWKAKGLMSYRLSRPDGWEIRMSDLVKRSPDGETAVRSGLQELEARGYLVRETLHDPATGRFAGVRLTVYEQPLPPDGGIDPGDVGRPVQADRAEAPLNEPARPCTPAALPPTALPTVGPPSTDHPHGENPNPANHALLNTDLTKTEGSKKDDVDDIPPYPPVRRRATARTIPPATPSRPRSSPSTSRRSAAP